jgi:N-acetylglucosaminyldiphosphoundecaprenol N-acetyl-beta-D-mannosaminyltransferase
LVLPDGIGVLAGLAYLEGERVWSVIGRALRGRLGETVTGVWLSEELVKLANKKKWRVFLLGGFGKTAERLVKKLRLTNSNLQIDFDKGEERLRENDSKDRQVIEKINKFAPDILLVAYGPGKQEKWIYKNKENLKAKIAIGVGGTFDELLDDSLRSPKWMERRGLKWLWRLIRQPRRLIRIYRAVVVFPWLVFRRHGR